MKGFIVGGVAGAVAIGVLSNAVGLPYPAAFIVGVLAATVVNSFVNGSESS